MRNLARVVPAVALAWLAGMAAPVDAGGYYYGPRIGVAIGGPWTWGSGWYWGGPWYGYAYPYGAPYGYGYPYAAGYAYPYAAYRYLPAASYVASTPYVEAPAQSSGSAKWYWCADPAGYYPHVASCRQPWMSVEPFAVDGAAPRSRESR